MAIRVCLLSVLVFLPCLVCDGGSDIGVFSESFLQEYLGIRLALQKLMLFPLAQARERERASVAYRLIQIGGFRRQAVTLFVVDSPGGLASPEFVLWLQESEANSAFLRCSRHLVPEESGGSFVMGFERSGLFALPRFREDASGDDFSTVIVERWRNGECHWLKRSYADAQEAEKTFRETVELFRNLQEASVIEK